MEDLEAHCAGEQGCMPDPKVGEDMITHEKADDALNRSIKRPLKYYIGRIKIFFKKYFNYQDF